VPVGDDTSPDSTTTASPGRAHEEFQADTDTRSGVAARSEHQPALHRPRTRLQNNISKPKKFGDDFVCLLTTTGELRYYEEVATWQEWSKAMNAKYQALERNNT
jgi:hypothetical protein